MFEMMVGVVIGLVLGWVFLPEPAFVRKFFERIGVSKSTAPVVTVTPAVRPTSTSSVQK